MSHVYPNRYDDRKMSKAASRNLHNGSHDIKIILV